MSKWDSELRNHPPPFLFFVFFLSFVRRGVVARESVIRCDNFSPYVLLQICENDVTPGFSGILAGVITRCAKFVLHVLSH